MNQPFSAQVLTTIVGATLAVALVTLTNAVALVTLTDKCGRPDKASKRRPKIDCKMQQTCNRSLLMHPLERDHYCSGQGYMTNFDRDIIKVDEPDGLDDGE